MHPLAVSLRAALCAFKIRFCWARISAWHSSNVSDRTTTQQGTNFFGQFGIWNTKSICMSLSKSFFSCPLASFQSMVFTKFTSVAFFTIPLSHWLATAHTFYCKFWNLVSKQQRDCKVFSLHNTYFQNHSCNRFCLGIGCCFLCCFCCFAHTLYKQLLAWQQRVVSSHIPSVSLLFSTAKQK